MRVILRMEIMGVSKEGFVRLYRTCREYHASIKHTDPASDSFYARMHFSDLDENTLLRIKEFVRRIDEISSYCEVLVAAIIPHENLPYTEATPKHGCPKRIVRCLRRICVKYVRSTHEGRGLLKANNGTTLVVCRRRATQVLPIGEGADMRLLTSPPAPARLACNDTSGLKRVLKQLKDAVSLLRQCNT